MVVIIDSIDIWHVGITNIFNNYGNVGLTRMKLFAVIKEFIHKAKQEAAEDYQSKPMVSTAVSSKDAPQKDSGRGGWIGIDLDGTLARSDSLWTGPKIGDPIPQMIKLTKQLVEKGARVKIFTARAADPDQVQLVKTWLVENGLPELEITNVKDFGMIRLYDDRAVQVVTNTGEIIHPPGHKG